ncbi:Uncharacterised protein [Streptococcus pneumoniae]|nr:Uncharacterised protein [Streptococcus pneumoniae]HEU6892950.1 hypothetical protein [Streptococcus pneumoniae]
MMEHIIKSLATKDTATVLLVLGLSREARLWHKQILSIATVKYIISHNITSFLTTL